mgnify:CR=1 FL=1
MLSLLVTPIALVLFVLATKVSWYSLSCWHLINSSPFVYEQAHFEQTAFESEFVRMEFDVEGTNRNTSSPSSSIS